MGGSAMSGISKRDNHTYEQDRRIFEEAYLKCFTRAGLPISCTIDDKRELLRTVQHFAYKAGLADNQTKFGSIQRAFINEAEVSKIYRITCYDL